MKDRNSAPFSDELVEPLGGWGFIVAWLLLSVASVCLVVGAWTIGSKIVAILVSLWTPAAAAIGA
jgi:hypothetical protein